MRPAAGSETAENPPYPVDDENMKKLVAILRIAVPYTGMILSTREVWHAARTLAWVLRHCLVVAVSQVMRADAKDWRPCGGLVNVFLHVAEPRDAVPAAETRY
jgi:hypothetical protein